MTNLSKVATLLCTSFLAVYFGIVFCASNPMPRVSELVGIGYEVVVIALFFGVLNFLTFWLNGVDCY